MRHQQNVSIELAKVIDVQADMKFITQLQGLLGKVTET